jgi:hypothetical protein
MNLIEIEERKDGEKRSFHMNGVTRRRNDAYPMCHDKK